MNWMWRGIVANGLILTVCIFYTYLIALWAYAGAFESTEIIDPTRTSCAIWEKDKMTPTLKIDCGLWTGCNTSAAAGDALYNAACTTDYLNQWSSVIGTSVAETAEANAAAAITGANGAFYTPHGNPDAPSASRNPSAARARHFHLPRVGRGCPRHCSRSFENPIWVNMFSNMSMNKAVLLAQVTLIIALYLPGLNTSSASRRRDPRLGLVHRLQGAVAAVSAASSTSTSPSSLSWRQSSPDTRRMRMVMSRALSRRTRLPSPSTSKDSATGLGRVFA